MALLEVEKLTQQQRLTRANIRNAFLIADEAEIRAGVQQAQKEGNWFVAFCILEISRDA